MWEEIFNLALNNGLWAVLFLILLVYVLKDSKSREAKYQETIETLAESLDIIHEVREDVQEIKNTLTKRINAKEKKEEKSNEE